MTIHLVSTSYKIQIVDHRAKLAINMIDDHIFIASIKNVYMLRIENKCWINMNMAWGKTLKCTSRKP